MKTVKTLYGQTQLDIAVQELGDAERVIELSVINNRSLSDEIDAATELEVPEADISKRSVVQLFSNKANAPASADMERVFNHKFQGIGYWVIGNDFIVQ